MGQGHLRQEHPDLGFEEPHHHCHAALQGQGLCMGMTIPYFIACEPFDLMLTLGI